MSNTEIEVGQKWVATIAIAFWKKGTIVEITETGDRIRFKNSNGQEDFIFNNPEGVIWFKSVYELVDDLTNKETGTAESIRSNILSIREKRNNLLMEITALGKEEAELVEKLKQQGFVLYEQNGSEMLTTEEKTVLYAEDIEEDMNDPMNWRIGDILEVCTGKYSGLWYIGDLVEIADVCDPLFLEVITKGSNRDVEDINAWNIYEIKEGEIKFHSRPVK